MYKIITVLLFTYKIVFVYLQSCDIITNLGVNTRVLENPKAKWNFTSVAGCISNISFPGDKVIHFWVTGAFLPILEKNFISHMKYLEEIYIEESYVEAIEPGAFLNLPKLKLIDINNNPIKNIPSGVFDVLPSLKILQIYQNKISNVEDGAFANLPNLNKFEMNENNLRYVKKEWFTNTSNIERFNVFRNSIEKIPSGLFHGWGKLRDISFNTNDISVIEGELFKDNPKFMTALGLHHNRLKSIAPNTFPDFVFIRYLSISGNLLNYLPEDFLRKIRVGNIAIFGNPFTCPCVEKINRIFRERGVTVDDPVATYAASCKDGDVPICGISTNHPQKCVEAVDKELTRRFLSYLKNLRYDTVRDPAGQQCAMFDHLD